MAGGALATPVSGIMSKAVKTCKVGDSETELMALMPPTGSAICPWWTAASLPG